MLSRLQPAQVIVFCRLVDGLERIIAMSAFQPSDHQLYFIYGSNMNPLQIAARCCKPEVVAVARLADYRHGNPATRFFCQLIARNPPEPPPAPGA